MGLIMTDDIKAMRESVKVGLSLLRDAVAAKEKAEAEVARLRMVGSPTRVEHEWDEANATINRLTREIARLKRGLEKIRWEARPAGIRYVDEMALWVVFIDEIAENLLSGHEWDGGEGT